MDYGRFQILKDGDLDTFYEVFYEVESAYKAMDDSDVEEAFSIMKEASSLGASFEKLSYDLAKEQAIQERQAKALAARISKESSSKVNEGDRLASFNPEVLSAWQRVAEIRSAQMYLEATARYLLRIYYDTKLVYENACRAMRNPVGGEKLVGRI